ncbi:hypothetical protein AZF37_01290 [endosymbiont 'TC1' of Trimyema compressum]|uniref:hypothetical protein n=1 Tax=endosymbiont 'TC1' of Trimyema compressum TaxID=243899 RepID=UPI0007F0BFC5|nr:hypothetical protein [endosymbiont 'TC1' of Trimyema compressum]AMP19994.1 hypothetical protein AZF37_01290 [endosymbiont 'TC1' of Trimyema compressum]
MINELKEEEHYEKAFISLIRLIIYYKTGCGTGDTITDNPINHIYGPNEVINIYDNVDTGDLIGTLRVTSANVLSEGPNYISQMASIDEEGNSVYEEVPYAQIIQINYVYEGTAGASKRISGVQF